jgi:hypothetical protein
METDQSTDRIDPAELAERAAYHTTAETTEHRALGVVVGGRPPLHDEAPAGAEAPRPWWQFWAR